jgi:hypothetical protein
MNHNLFMRILLSLIVVLAALVVDSCSRQPSPPTTELILTNRAAMGAFMTNSVEVLQARYHELTNDSQKIRIELDQLMSAGRTNDQAFVDEQQRYTRLWAFSVDLQRQIALQQYMKRHANAQKNLH